MLLTSGRPLADGGSAVQLELNLFVFCRMHLSLCVAGASAQNGWRREQYAKLRCLNMVACKDTCRQHRLRKFDRSRIRKWVCAHPVRVYLPSGSSYTVNRGAGQGEAEGPLKAALAISAAVTCWREDFRFPDLVGTPL